MPQSSCKPPRINAYPSHQRLNFHKAGYDENIELDKKGGVKESCLDAELFQWAVVDLGIEPVVNLEDGPGIWRCFILLNMGIFEPAMLVYQRIYPPWN